MFMWRLKALLLCLVMAWPAVAEDRFAQHLVGLRKRLPGPEFRTTLAPPFVVVGDLSSEELDRYARTTVGWAVKHLKSLYFNREPAEILDVWLFKDAASYQRNVRRLTGSDPTTPYGFYSPRHGGLFMNIHTGGGTLVHELVHPFVHTNFPACPDWFNEGLASLYEQSDEKNGHIWGLTNWRLAGLQQAIKARSLGTFKRMTELTDSKFYEDDRGNNYAQARYLCLYLQEKGKLTDFYHRFLAASPQDPSGYKTLGMVLGVKDMAEFQKSWENWVLELRFD